MYLRIVNPTECPVEGFTILGVSSSRDESAKIGEFGSGSKMGVLTCLRHGINPTIYCGTKRLEFFTQPKNMGDKVFNQVFIKEADSEPRALSMAMEYGERDWGGLSMALREFVSNALDAARGDVNRVTIDVVSKLTPIAGKTVVGLPLTPDVQQWLNALPSTFLQFGPNAKENLSKTILVKTKPGPCRVFRKGVLVREVGDVSLFDYNMGDELKIDESRNLSESSVRDNVGMIVGKHTKALLQIFSKLPTEEQFWESELPSWELTHQAREYSDMWKRAWANTHGSAVISQGATPLTDMADKQGKRVVLIYQSNWYDALIAAGIPSVLDVLDGVSSKGDVIKEPELEDRMVLNRVWEWLEKTDLTNGRSKPPLKLFERIMRGESQTNGYYDGGTVYIHLEDRANLQTYLEEVTHHVTGASDYSRDFQDFSFRLAAKLAKQAKL